MTPNQFDTISQLTGAGRSNAALAARLVLVEGVAPAEAARQLCVSPSSCSNAVTRYRRNAELIDAAWL